MRGSRLRRPRLAFAGVVAAAVTAGLALAFGAVVASANVALTQVSSDPYTNTTSFHATEVEPDTFAFGSSLVADFQVGRFFDGGASNIGFSTSTDGGTTFTAGFLPGTTVFATPPGIFPRVSDPSVAFDAKHGVWLVNYLGIVRPIGPVDVLVSRSTDGGMTFGLPVVVSATSAFFDKNWIVCDNTPSSPHFGNCYVEFDNHSLNNQLEMFRSSDGGVTWRQSAVPHALVIGGQPVVQPNGTVVMPIDNAFESKVESFVSTDGGASYSGPFLISRIIDHQVAGDLRTSPLPSAEIDASGTVYAAWQDCRFITACRANDVVFSRSSDGMHWSAVARIPIDPTTSGVDHFIPGLAVDRNTSGSSASLGLTFYFYPNAACTTATCQLDVGFISSSTGGATWSAPTMLAGPMTLGSLPLTTQGFMVGDYISTSFNSTDLAHGVFAVSAPGTTCTLGVVTSCNEAMFTNASGLTASSPAPLRVATTGPVKSTHSDHAASTAPLTAR